MVPPSLLLLLRCGEGEGVVQAVGGGVRVGVAREEGVTVARGVVGWLEGVGVADWEGVEVG